MSSSKKKGLGKGLSALFGELNVKETQSDGDKKRQSQKTALIGELNRNKYQPRSNFNDDKLNELSESIKQNGLIQPIAVRHDKADPGKFEIVAGERRWMAAQKAGLHEVPIVLLDLNDNQALEVAIVENIQREDLNIVEEAKGYDRLRSEFGYDHEKIAKFMSKSRSHVSNTLRLLTLPKDVISMLEDGLLTAGQARPLVGLPRASDIAEEIINKKLSARQVERFTNTEKRPLSLIKTVDSNIEAIKNEIEASLGLKVMISNKRNNSGKITIHYSNLEQFDLISKLLKQK
ncbi:MAG: chromosome partitioning protein ParB [Pelagibacterales bacterium MED-G40]|nr:MAG: chromosome partitioning protein ParB [Pelagibacterales bacterium MED-G40]|tara:strand:- start:26586 stop:27455 length:870 start_codon:yes stop_codon:yes gene_type:complete